MAHLMISLDIPDNVAPHLEGREMLLTPVTDFEVGQMAVALDQVHRLLLNAKSQEAQDFKTATEQLDFVRTIFGRSALVAQIQKGDMQ